MCNVFSSGTSCHACMIYFSFFCYIAVVFCASDPCHDGGTCKDTEHGYNCLCNITHEGTHCETKSESTILFA